MSKLTLEHIESVIEEETYVFPEGTRHTICVLKLRNGFVETGESACKDIEDFCEDTGKSIARQNAVNSVWKLEAYLAKELEYQAKESPKP